MDRPNDAILALTPQQREVVSCQADLLAVNAFAGTGKTATLRAYAQARPETKILYLAFNRSVAQEAREKMPPNVTVKTSHALAWARVARSWPPNKIAGKVTAWTLLNAAKNEPALNDKGSALARAQVVLECIRRFTHSAHMNVAEFSGRIDAASLAQAALEPQEFAALVTRIWARMCDPDDALPAEHDTYFKIWQMSKPVLPYDIILLDEAQDTNPALFDVFMRQRHAKRVLVGDRHQNIYGFRGAINAMEGIDEPHQTLALTTSFRFGQPVADLASALLQEFKDERHSLIGAGPQDCKVGTAHTNPSVMQTAILFRTNAGLFQAAAKLCRKADIALLGSFEDYAFNDILDTYHLKVGRIEEIRNPYIKSFGAYESLVGYADSTDDRELKARIKVIDEFRHDVPEIYRLVKNSVQPQADLLLTTAHKSKGSQWPQVVLADDFADLMSEEGTPLSFKHLSGKGGSAEALPAEEANLWYVAITRAQNSLVVSPQLESFWRFTTASPARKPSTSVGGS